MKFKKLSQLNIIIVLAVVLFVLATNPIDVLACGGSKCAARSGTSAGSCPGNCSGGICWLDSLSSKCVGHDLYNSRTSTREAKISGPVESSRTYTGSTYSGTSNIDNGKQSRTRYDKYKVTYQETWATYETVYVKCHKCSLPETSTGEVQTSTYNKYNTVDETETSPEYRIRSVINEYRQETTGAWPSSPDKIHYGEWGDWYGDYTGHAASYVGSNLPKKGASNVKSHCPGWSRGITDEHYASNTHTSNSKTDANVPSQTATDGNRTWHRYIWRKQYYLRLYPNNPSNASTPLNWMGPNGTSNHATNSGKYMKIGSSHYERLSYVGEKFYIPKTYETYQIIGYASRNKWYTAITGGGTKNEGTNMIPLGGLSGYGDPSTLYSIRWYAQWFSEPGKLYLMPNSSGVGTDSGFGAYIDSSDQQNDTYLYDTDPDHSKHDYDNASRP